MTAVTFAFSVHTFIDKIGAYAGFAAAVGLALLVLLIFSQARELRRLREWGAQAHDRIGELEQRLAAAFELARRSAAPAQRPAAPTGAPALPGAVRPGQPARSAGAARPVVTASTSAPTRLPLLPAAPAGVGGPALASATMVVPLPAAPPSGAPSVPPVEQGVSLQPVAVPTPTPTSSAAPQPARSLPGGAPAVVAAPAPSGAQPSALPLPATAAAQAPAAGAATAPEPATAVEPPAGTNGIAPVAPPTAPSGPEPTARPPAARPPAGGRRPAAAGSAGRPARPAPARPGRAAAPLRASTPSATPRGGNGRPTSVSPRRRVAIVLAAVAVVLVLVAIVLVATSGGGSPSALSGAAAAPGRTTAAQTQRSSGQTIPHGRIVVAVLNGTPTQGLANTVADTLAAAGFRRGPVANAADHQRSVTVVSYLGGHQQEAEEVAAALHVPSDAVQAIDAGTQASACGSAAASCTATVVVTVGADRHG